MFSINFNLASYTGLSVGPSLTAVGYIGPGAAQQPARTPVELTVPWHDLQEDPRVFSLLSWHTSVSEFAGRDAEIKELREWAKSEPAISIKFVTGEGGVGKSRLGAEFAAQLQQEDWAAGFIDLRKLECFALKKEGTLVVIDYPEEHREAVAELLRDLTMLGRSGRLRVLFLTREQGDQWQGLFRDCNALNLMDSRPVDLGRLDGEASYKLFCTAQERAAEVLKTAPAPVSKEDFLQWLPRFPENERPLFIVATAAQTALDPNEPVFGYKGREIVNSLAERELSHIRTRAANRNLKDDYVFARVLALAAIADVVPIELVGELAGREELEFGFPADSHIGDELEAAGLVVGGKVRAPKPDILAAAFTVKVLARNPKAAPEIIWAALSQDVSGSLERLGRLSFDAEITLQMLEHRLGQWLADAVEDNVERCESLRALSWAAPPLGLLSAAIVICKTLLTVSADEERARILNNLTNHLRDMGDTAGAVEAVQEALEIYRRLSDASPQRYLPNLASSLNNLSNSLSDMGDTAGALEAGKEAVDIYHKLSDARPQRYLPDLATSLNNLSNRLGAVGDMAGALEAVKEAVDIQHKLSDAIPQRYLPNLAGSLGTLGTVLLARNEYRRAREAFAEGIELVHPFASQFPASPFEELLKKLTSALERARKAGQGD